MNAQPRAAGAFAGRSALAQHAGDWAETVAGNGKFGHRPDSPFGETIHEITGAWSSPEEVVWL